VTKQEDTDDDDDKPAWDDSDDERLVVSLASVPQLRKLRDTEEDDMVNGKEYVRRLRRQYERLYPVPDWAIHASGKTKRKRRHIEDDESDAESASDMDVDDDDLSTLPLARLLQDADILSRTSKNSTKRRKLQAGTVEIARLKDVTGAGPVSDLFPLRIVFTDLIVTGCYNFLVVPSHVPAPSVLWPQLNALASPRERLRPP
jgi:U3 small nucleolar RNA-associated protein 18